MRIGYQLNAKPNRSFIRSALIDNSKKVYVNTQTQKNKSGDIQANREAFLKKTIQRHPTKIERTENENR